VDVVLRRWRRFWEHAQLVVEPPQPVWRCMLHVLQLGTLGSASPHMSHRCSHIGCVWGFGSTVHWYPTCWNAVTAHLSIVVFCQCVRYWRCVLQSLDRLGWRRVPEMCVAVSCHPYIKSRMASFHWLVVCVCGFLDMRRVNAQ
jgi:hypothetical protein